MSYEFVAKNGLVSHGNVNVSGSITSSGNVSIGHNLSGGTEVIVEDVPLGSGNGVFTPDFGANFSDSNGLTFNFYVYAYKTVGAGRVYSVTPETITYSEGAEAGQTYYLHLGWTAVAGADGYKVVIGNDDYNGYYGDYYLETVNDTLNYGDGTEAGVTYEDPMVVTPTSSYPDTFNFIGSGTIRDLTVVNNITATSLIGTSSWANNSISASWSNNSNTASSVNGRVVTSNITSSGGLIVSAGNVGIGTATPHGLLQVANTVGADTVGGNIILTRNDDGGASNYRGGAIFSYYYAASERDTLSFAVSGDTTPLAVGKVKMVITTTGKVGIGTTSPGGTLPASFTGTGGILEIRSADTSNDIGLFLRRSDGVTGLDIHHNGAGGALGYATIFNNIYVNSDYRFQVAGSEKLRLTSTGNLGVGTTAPDKRVEINLGTADALRLTYNDTNGSAAVYSDSTLSSTGVMTITPVGSAPAIAFAAPARLKGYTVGTLPTGVQGDTAFVTDALAPTFLAIIVGGGAVVTPVFHNGTNWVGY